MFFNIRVLVAIANYGFKNIEYLKRLIQEYQAMPCNTHITVLSNVPKELGPNVEVAVGLPTKDPWSLPFGHKKIFSERIEDYDLFIYSEDDVLVTWKNIETFLHLTKMLPKNDICGFLRYELDLNDKKFYPDFVGPYHWLPKSVKKIEQFTFAEFSNAHSACYVLTREQLRTALSSGGYLVEPHQGRYDLLCSAATDPYIQCGFNKMICISHISDLLVHHLPNKYVGKLGINENDFDKQITFMLSSDYACNVGQELFITTKNINTIIWDKAYFDGPDKDLISLVSQDAKRILTVGCGNAVTEGILIRNGYKVTSIPLDPIVGALAASKGVAVMEANFDQAFQALYGTSFDCIVFSDVLQHLKDPVDILSKTIRLLADDGELLISIPNFKYIKFLKDHYPIFKKWTYSKHLLQTVDKKDLTEWFKLTGFTCIFSQYVVESHFFKKLSMPLGIFKVLFASRQIVRGRKRDRISQS